MSKKVIIIDLQYCGGETKRVSFRNLDQVLKHLKTSKAIVSDYKMAQFDGPMSITTVKNMKKNKVLDGFDFVEAFEKHNRKQLKRVVKKKGVIK